MCGGNRLLSCGRKIQTGIRNLHEFVGKYLETQDANANAKGCDTGNACTNKKSHLTRINVAHMVHTLHTREVEIRKVLIQGTTQ